MYDKPGLKLFVTKKIIPLLYNLFKLQKKLLDATKKQQMYIFPVEKRSNH